MELQPNEQRLVNHGEDLATIKAKLNNGMTEDIGVIKKAIKELSASFQVYKDNREETCLYKRDIKSGRGERRAKIAVLTAVVAVVLNMTGIILTKLL